MGFKCLLSSRSLIRVSGAAAHEFLQGLFTNDLRLLRPEGSVWGCFLSHNGRLLCDAHLYQPPGASEGRSEILVDVHHSVADMLQGHLLEMRMRKRVEINDLRKELVVVATFLEKNTSGDDKGVSPCHGSKTFLDPRSFALPAPLHKTILPADEAPSVTDPETCYISLLCAAGIGEGPDVFRPNKTLPFEGNTDMLRGVSFHKGCYLGQELTHRTHVMLVTRKRTVPLRLPCAQSETGGERRVVEKGEALFIDKQKVGEVLTVCGDVGLGLLRLRYVDGSTRTAPGLALHDALPVAMTIPAWWEEKVVKKALSSQ